MPNSVPFDGRRDRARIGNIIPQVGAFVDARHHYIRPDRQKAFDRQIHAVGRCAVDREAARGDFVDTQRAMQGQGMADGVPLPVGRHGIHLADAFQGLFECQDALGVDTVVVGHQNVHACISAESRKKEKAIGQPTALSIGVSRFERPTTRTPSECATRLRHTPLCVPVIPSVRREGQEPGPVQAT